MIPIVHRETPIDHAADGKADNMHFMDIEFVYEVVQLL